MIIYQLWIKKDDSQAFDRLLSQFEKKDNAEKFAAETFNRKETACVVEYVLKDHRSQ